MNMSKVVTIKVKTVIDEPDKCPYICSEQIEMPRQKWYMCTHENRKKEGYVALCCENKDGHFPRYCPLRDATYQDGVELFKGV